MSTLSSEELREERQRVMGPELGTVFHALWGHVVELHGEFDQFRKLFGSPDTTAVLNDTAGSLFRTVRRVFGEHVLLYVARVTDREETCGHPNLTVKRLPALIADAALKAEVESILGAAEEKWKPVRDLRNKWLAHLDLLVWTDDPDAEPLTEMSNAAIEDALSTLRDVLAQIEQKYFGPADRRYDPVSPYGDVDHLLFWLRRGLAAEEHRRKRIMTGNPLPEDFER
jgi:hypothetical protein